MVARRPFVLWDFASDFFGGTFSFFNFTFEIRSWFLVALFDRQCVRKGKGSTLKIKGSDNGRRSVHANLFRRR